MYNRRLDDVSILRSHIEFRSALDRDAVLAEEEHSEAMEVSERCLDYYYEALFQDKLMLYLEGLGHPDHWFIRSVVSDTDFEAGRHDPLLRARRFLQLMTGSDLIPIQDNWKLVVSLLACPFLPCSTLTSNTDFLSS